MLPPAFGGPSPVKVCLVEDEGDAPRFTGKPNRCVLFFPFFALVGLSSPVKVCLFEDEGDVQIPIAFKFQIEISFQINVNRIVHRIVIYHFYLLYIVLYIQL